MDRMEMERRLDSITAMLTDMSHAVNVALQEIRYLREFVGYECDTVVSLADGKVVARE